jgi:hypothetical protein
MDLIVMIAAGAVALVGQWLNSQRSIPAPAVKATLALAGIPFFIWSTGLPPAWSGPEFTVWSQGAVLWCFAIPGIASLAGLAPGMATDSRP